MDLAIIKPPLVVLLRLAAVNLPQAQFLHRKQPLQWLLRPANRMPALALSRISNVLS